MQQPSSVHSQTQLPQVRLHWATHRPFWQQQSEHRPCDSMRQRFCIAPQAISSSQRQCNLKPFAHFSNSRVQRGTICQLPAGDEAAPGCQVGVDIGCVATAEHSDMVAVAIKQTPFRSHALGATQRRSPGMRRLSEVQQREDGSTTASLWKSSQHRKITKNPPGGFRVSNRPIIWMVKSTSIRTFHDRHFALAFGRTPASSR